jgi:hypothetical protein
MSHLFSLFVKAFFIFFLVFKTYCVTEKFDPEFESALLESIMKKSKKNCDNLSSVFYSLFYLKK